VKTASLRLMWLAVVTFWVPSTASAHVFFAPYALPVPFWMYLYACAATLIVSFAVVGYFVGASTALSTYRAWDLLPNRYVWQLAWRSTVHMLRVGAVGCLLLTITAGLVGTGDPAANINVTLFWVVFLLGFTYVTAVAGDLYRLMNPWRVLVDWGEKLGINLSRPRVRYPQRLGYFPALAFYMTLIWIELFALPRPYVLSMALIAYTTATFTGAFLFGKQTWFEYGELFAVFFFLVGTMAPVEYLDAPKGGPARIRLRPPFVAALYERHKHASLVVFVLFMLSSTTYDAIHETLFWVSLYWQRLVPAVQPLWGGDVIQAQVAVTNWYMVYQRLGLLISPFVYLLFYVVVLACARLITKTRAPLGVLMSRFALSLVPIALVYHATHYYTVLITQLPSLLYLASDPFGWGWRLFATASRPQLPLDMGFIWHTQVVLMLAGHVVAVYLAHRMALGTFPSRAHGVLSQIPMLVLMVGYTCVGLWALSLPLALPQVLPGG
jgi:hypothetical protein